MQTHLAAWTPQIAIPSSTATKPPGWVVPNKLNGSLPKPIDQMTGDELRTLADTIQKGVATPPAPIPCEPAAQCPNGTTDVSIAATDDARFLTATNAGVNGTVVAVVRGVQHPTKGYHFTPNATFIFVVYPGTGSTAPWSMYKIPKGLNTHGRVDTGVLHECTPGQKVYWSASAATFAECGQVLHAQSQQHVGTFGQTSPLAPAGLGAIDLSLLRSPFALLSMPFNGETSGWLTCDSGCCTMEQT